MCVCACICKNHSTESFVARLLELTKTEYTDEHRKPSPIITTIISSISKLIVPISINEIPLFAVAVAIFSLFATHLFKQSKICEIASPILSLSFQMFVDLSSFYACFYAVALFHSLLSFSRNFFFSVI